MEKQVVALIGVRGGSQRVVNKNSRPFSGSNLLSIKIDALKRVPGISRVVVNSECPQLLAIARDCGADTIVRDPLFASHTVLSSDYYRHIAEHCDADIILSATATTPLVEPASFQRGIETYFSKDSCFDSVTSCQSIREFLYRDGIPLNYDPRQQVPSQQLPNIIAINYGYSILRREDMIRRKNIVGSHPLFIELSKIESVDIDTPEDFMIAELLYREKRLARGFTKLAS